MTALADRPRRILVTGSRDWENELVISRALGAANHYLLGLGRILVHGACPTGADEMAARLVTEFWHWPIEPHPADWDRLGPSAGPIRNQEMVSAGADLCLAFWRRRSVGTRITIRLAGQASIPIWIWRA